MARIRAIIVDDSPEFIKIAQRYIDRSQQIDLIGTAQTGEEAVAVAESLHPDLILMDLILPGMNGVEATRVIKKSMPNITVVMMTLYDLDEYRNEALLAGADEFINKSQFSDSWVDSLVEKMMAKRKKLSILVVDDSPTIRRMVMTSLRPLGADFGEATTGLEALEMLSLTEYDAVTLDLNMPDMHGIEVLTFLRASERFRDLPVLVLTTRGDDESRDLAMAEGANGYLTKPFRPEELVKQVKEILRA